MANATGRRLIVCACLAIPFALAPALHSASLEPGGGPVVYAAEVDSIIHPVSAEFMIDAIDRADRANARLIVFTLRTPGGLVDSTRIIVTRMLAAKTPVAIFVGPAGSRAASAGFILTIACDLAVMAPGTHIGAASPVAGGGEKMDDTMARKATADLAAYVRTLAGKRRRNVNLADETVTKSRAFTEDEALAAVPPLVDYVARDLNDLLAKADGRVVSRFDGSTVTLATRGATVIPIEMNWRQTILSAVAHPNVAYLLMSLGMLGLTIELWSPGAILPGIAGGLCLLLAFFAFQVLPVNYAGVLLVLFGLTLLVLEIKVSSYGLLTVGGLLSLFFGSTMLMDSPAPEFRVSLRVILPVTLGLAGILIFLVRLGIASQRGQPITGVAGMLNESGRALSEIAPGAPGRVTAHGEIWRAEAREPITEGQSVTVVAVNGLTLTVEPATRDR